MRSILRWIWSLHWPPGARQLALLVMTLPGVHLIFFPHFMVGVVGLIRDEAGAVLLLRHTYRAKQPWGLPTGFLEHREQPADALRREIAEETGFKVQLDPEPHVYTSARRPIVNIVYTGKYREGTFTSGPEVSEARFFEDGSLPPMQPDQRELLFWLTQEATH